MTVLGCDTGGTFTDVVVNQAGRLKVLKVPTTRPDPGRGVLAAVDQLRLAHEFEMAHGTTVGTNALLERKGARTALVTTRGFADLLVLGRGTRPELYAIHPRRRPPLPEVCLELDERVDSQGQVLRALQPAEVEAVADRLSELGVEAVAVCLLFSFGYPEHEQMVGQALRRRGLTALLSSDISPEYREYERASTTALAAYLQPLLAGYLGRLEEQLAGRGSRRFWVVHSAGAVMTAAEASHSPNAVVLSGPAAGVRGAFTVASACGYTQLLTLDMGGTSTDVSLCPGRVATVTQSSLEDVPVRQPMIDIHTVGAGGGSIAWLDAGGALQVGPESAGSDPGPAAYGKGHRPTVTDAHLVLGRLPIELAGGVKLDRGRARQALAQLAEPLGCSPEEAAAGVLRVAATHMERALRVISIERGFDPRQFTLVPFGGAGPLQACELAERLGVKTVLLAPSPGVLSALGAAVAPWLREFSRTVLGADLEPVEAELRAEALAQMGQVELESMVDLRYRGQGSELTLALGDQLEERFHQAHQQRYGYHRAQTPVERVTLRVRASQPRPVPTFEPPAHPARLVGSQTVWHHGQELECRLFERGLFAQPEAGPAVLLQYDTTTFVPPGWSIHQAGACLRLEPV